MDKRCNPDLYLTAWDDIYNAVNIENRDKGSCQSYYKYHLGSNTAVV
jgi:hypothetical protein